MGQRPLAVTLIGWIYIAVGAAGFVYHFRELTGGGAVAYDAIAVELLRLMAIVAGAFLLLGRNWARWTALAWIGFHVVVSAFHSLAELAIHSLVFAVIVLLLFRSSGGRYFGSPSTTTG